MQQFVEAFESLPAQDKYKALEKLAEKCTKSQLSHIGKYVEKLLKTDFIEQLPNELAIKVFRYLDAASLCQAARVSSSWKKVADDDVLWYRMCEQHIDRKCAKCGWGLPLLDRKRKTSLLVEDASKRIKLDTKSSHIPPSTHSASCTLDTPHVPAVRPWKDIYSERLVLERNWRRGKYKKVELVGHEDGIMSMQISESQGILITGSYDCTLRVWDTDTWNCIRVLRGHTGCVRAVQFDESKIISGSTDCTLRIWNLKTGECCRILNYHTEAVISLHFDDTHLVSGSSDSSIKVWNISTGKCFSLTGHSDWVNKVQIINGGLLVSCSDDNTVRLWDLETRSVLRVFQGHVGPIQCFQVSAHQDGAKLRLSDAKIITGSLDHTLRIWSFTTAECLKTLFGHEEGIWGVAVDRLRIASSGHDGTVRLWDAESGVLMHTFKPSSEATVSCCQLSDMKLVSGGEDHLVHIWDFSPSP